MKTRDLIAKLHELDPEGDVEVCIDNEDILCVYRLPAWYDGRLQVMERDLANPYYNVTGFKIVGGAAEKIQVQTQSWKEALYDHVEMPVVCDPPSEHYEKRITQSRDIARRRLAQWGVAARP